MRNAKPLRILISKSHNPWFNIATEDWIFNELEGDEQILYLWQNADTVVIGRNQNPWSECNLQKMEEDHVTLARRVSGGGAVFHDLGNTCFTFLSPKEGYSKTQNIEILLGALARLGISQAQASGRNDLVIEQADGPRKISGSAYRETQKKAFHHGTFLISTDLGRLANYLTPHPKKLAAKGKASVRARVMNLCEVAPQVTHDKLCAALMDSFCDFHQGQASPEFLDQDWMAKQPGLAKMFDQMASWDWRFGQAPNFQIELTEQLSWGLFTLHLDCTDARILRAQVDSDSLYPDVVEALGQNLIGETFTKTGVALAIAKVEAGHPHLQTELRELQTWLQGQVEV